MGLSVKIKGKEYGETYDCGYITYNKFLRELCKTFYATDTKMYEIYCKSYDVHSKPNEDDIKYWDAYCNEDLDLLLWHSDCDGKFTPQECRKIHNVIKDLHMDMICHNYGDMKPYNMLERWKDMFRYCAKRRVNMYYY